MIAILCLSALSAALVGAYRWLALHYRWLDAPNQRSSHAVVTPRGAGCVFALLILGTAIALLQAQSAVLFSLLAGLIVAAVGWCDDLRGVSARLRFALYGAACALAAISVLSAYDAHAISPSLLLIAGAVVALALLWLVNLYNFMDGINGIAGLEALFVLLASAYFAADTPYAQVLSELHGYATAAIFGFLIWNFPAGKVFMGDAGSAFLGFFLGVLLLWSIALDGPLPATWLILLGIFIVDSGYTLLVRIATKQRWYAAHRLHAYQRLTDRLRGRHTHTIIILSVINLGWLLPMAWLVQNRFVASLWGIALAYLPLIVACRWLKAGIPARAGI